MSNHRSRGPRGGAAIRLATLLVLSACGPLTSGCGEGAGVSLPDMESPSLSPEGLDHDLLDDLKASPDGRADAIVYLDGEADLSPALAIADWNARGDFVYTTLVAFADASQADLRAALDAWVAQGLVQAYRPYFIVNAVFVRRAPREMLKDISHMNGVREVTRNASFGIDPGIGAKVAGAASLPWGVPQIKADQVWSTFGVNGKNVVVANIDTGVLAPHAALLSSYRGFSMGTDNYNWFDPTNTFPTTPGDNDNHGTHTMGIMVGDGGPGYRIGVAPGAKWIAAKGCLNQNCFQADLLSAGQWILAPTNLAGQSPNPALRPHVVNNSWGDCNSGATWYQSVVKAWRAADIFPAFSAGNVQPGCVKVAAPGSYPESFTSGSTDAADVIASDSLQGPSPLTSNVKPDVSAPGVDVLSSLANGSYGPGWGTSVASPHTAGCAALIRSLKPWLPVYQIETVLEQTALDLGSPGKDSVYGNGRIDCFKAVSLAASPWWQYLSGNGGSGQFGVWSINPSDKYIAGDFDGDNRDELLAVSNGGWSHLMYYGSGVWNYVWGNNGNGKIGLWNMNPNDTYVAGDFDGNGRDELLTFSPGGWSHLTSWNGSSWQYVWGNGGAGVIASWLMSPNDRFIAADFDGDGRDDLLAIANNGSVQLMKWNGSSWQNTWAGGGQIASWLMNTTDRYIAADFDGDGRDDLLAIANNGSVQLMRWNGSSWQNTWAGGGQIASWLMNITDKYVAADFDADGRAELVAFSAGGWSHTMKWNGSSWQYIWGNGGSYQIAVWGINAGDQYAVGNFDASTSRAELLAVRAPWTQLMKYDN